MIENNTKMTIFLKVPCVLLEDEKFISHDSHLSGKQGLVGYDWEEIGPVGQRLQVHTYRG